jgi:hypothetical protein
VAQTEETLMSLKSMRYDAMQRVYRRDNFLSPPGIYEYAIMAISGIQLDSNSHQPNLSYKTAVA